MKEEFGEMNSTSVMTEWESLSLANDYRVTRRPMPSCTRRLPLCARSACWAVLAPGTFEDCTVRPFVKLIWSVRGTGVVTFDGRDQPLPAGRLAVFFPGTLHRARAGNEAWEVRWWTVDGPLATAMVAEFGLEQEGIYEAGPAPVALLEALREALEDVSPQGESRASVVAYELIAAAAAQSRALRQSPIVEAARTILETEWYDPALDITTLAARLRLHRSSFTRQFTEEHGLSPSQYLIRLRLGHALSLLQQTALPIKAIAHRCGFSSANYFARTFRRTQHMTPQQWRES